MSTKYNDVIKFTREKDYKFIKEISNGRGSCGQTVLIEDEFIHKKYVCKKFKPESRIPDEFHKGLFERFVQEAQLLYELNNRNIVRAFNHYFYPDQLTGYLLMEYVNGYEIDKYLKMNPESINDIFVQAISGFKHIEDASILHRDIRPRNIMVTKDGVVKIIDFGFGKRFNFDEMDDKKSITLNWGYPIPSEFSEGIYDLKTQVYFVGHMFRDIIDRYSIEMFSYKSILRDMIVFDCEKRVENFSTIQDKIYNNRKDELGFSKNDKKIYKAFADSLLKTISRVSKMMNITMMLMK